MRLTLIAIMLVALAFAASAQAHITRTPHRCANKIAPRLCAIHFHAGRTNTLRTKAHAPRIVYEWVADAHPTQRPRILSLWIKRQGHARRLLSHYQHSQGGFPSDWLRGALCVHHYEGAWNANTGNSFYGGFQYLQSTWIASGGLKYASRADLASPHDQLLVTYHVTSRYGWGQWPNTARMCGLL